MLKIVDCVTQQHDLGRLAIAVLICAFGSYATVALGVFARTGDSNAKRLAWAAATVVTTTCAIWATHFIAMLAFRIPMQSGFLVVPTILSFFTALVFVGFSGVIGFDSRRRRTAIAAGTVLGIAISAMHMVGMSALRIQGSITWDPWLLAAAIATGIVFSVAGSLSVKRRGETRPLRPAACFAFAVCGDHCIAMCAATLHYDPTVTLPGGLIDEKLMTWIVVVAAALLLAFALTAYRLHLKAHKLVTAERRRLEAFADLSVEGLLICDGETIVWANRSLESLTGTRREALVGRSVATLLSSATLNALERDGEIDTTLGDGPAATPVRVLTKAIQFGARPHTVVAFRDQRERLRAEAEMRRLASSDSLTGLANRARFLDVLDTMLSSRRADEREFALLSLDLDRFKHVNDSHGHAVGDAVLVRVARRLSAVVRDGTLVARIGGDEFSIIARSPGGQAGIRALADRVVEVLSRPFVVDGQVHEIGASVGVAVAPSDGDTASVLVRNADLALYRAKDEGGGAYRMFESGMDARMQDRRRVEIALRRAVARQEFQLYYQPQVDARTGRYTGAEALIRWIDPERGLVPPSDFIPIAEETNLIAAIGEWVLHTACAEAVRWPAHLNVAVNLSPIQFRDPRLLSIVASALDESGLPGNRLELEITESVLIDDEATVIGLLQGFRRLGVRISLDDFGTGYSSLGHLHRFHFDKIKIDRSFVSRAPDDRDSAAIVRAIVSLGASFNIATTAEGVETDAQRRFVADEGCDQIQGYLFSRPLPADQMPDDFRATPPETERSWHSSDSCTEATAS